MGGGSSAMLSPPAGQLLVHVVGVFAPFTCPRSSSICSVFLPLRAALNRPEKRCSGLTWVNPSTIREERFARRILAAMAPRPSCRLSQLAFILCLAALPAFAQAPETSAPPAITAPAASDVPAAAAADPGITLRAGEEVPYPGGPIPHGARLLDVPRTGLFVTGAVLVGLGWVPSMLAGLLMATVGSLFAIGGGGGAMLGVGLGMLVPVIGPAIFAGYGLLPSSMVPLEYTVFFAADFVVQAAGFALALWAHLNPRQVLRGTGSPMDGAVSWAILPAAGATLSGATFALRF